MAVAEQGARRSFVATTMMAFPMKHHAQRVRNDAVHVRTGSRRGLRNILRRIRRCGGNAEFGRIDGGHIFSVSRQSKRRDGSGRVPVDRCRQSVRIVFRSARSHEASRCSRTANDLVRERNLIVRSIATVASNSIHRNEIALACPQPHLQQRFVFVGTIPTLQCVHVGELADHEA